MFGFKKKLSSTNGGDAKAENASGENSSGWYSRLTQGLTKTRANLTDKLTSLVLGKKTLSADLLDEIETQLILADTGIDATRRVIAELQGALSRKELVDNTRVLQALKESLRLQLQSCAVPLVIDQSKKPYVILVVGVNGAGKTTTIGKLAYYLQQEGAKVMLAAGDTFRAAAVEQLQTWGLRNNIPVVAQRSGADAASVIYDALSSAQAKGMDVLIADTAGRLHTQTNLMEELKKVKRVIQKMDASAPHEVLLVLDAGTGQNALSQARQFNEAVGVTGLVLTKLDGTAKGGVIFAIANQLAIPIRFIGVGESIEDLQEFKVDQFIEALFTGSDPVN